MKNQKIETASFLLRFTPKVFENEQGEADIQWRGSIKHVQDGDEKKFSDFEKAVDFMNEKLSELTIEAVNTKSQEKEEEEEEGVISKGLNLWKQLARDAPKNMVDSFLNPKKGVENIQNQINQVGELISTKRSDFDTNTKKLTEELRFASKADFKELLELYQQMAKDISRLTEKVEEMNDKL